MRSTLALRAFASLVWLLALLALLAPEAGRAQSLTLSPAVVPLSGHHGQSVTQRLTLQNDSDLPLDFVMEAHDVVVRDGARVFVPAGELPGSIAASAVFTPRQLRAEPHSSAVVTATFTLPPAAQHRAVVALFRGASLVQSGSRKARLSLGTLFTFTVSDHLSVAAGALEADPPSASSSAQIRSTLVNDGTEPVVPSGMAVILDAGGRLVGKAAFPARRLLPGERATLLADYPGDLPSGSYRAVATFDVAGHALTQAVPLNVP